MGECGASRRWCVPDVGTDPMIVSAGTWHLDNQTVLDAACQLASRPMTQDEWDLYLPTGEPYEPACADER